MPSDYTKPIAYGRGCSGIRFPAFRSDDTFGVYVHLDAPLVPSANVESWLEEWVANNEEWFGWSEIFQSDSLCLSDSFFRSPHLVLSDNERLIIRLDGKAGARFWKDWYARLVTELIARFPEIELVKVTNC